MGINEISKAKPLQAAFASGLSFTCGAALPLLVSVFFPLENMVYYQYCFAIAFLIALGAIAAKTGGSGIFKAVVRISLWGTIAMILSAAVGYAFGVAT